MSDRQHVFHVISHLYPYGGTAAKYLAWVSRSVFQHTFILYEASRQCWEHASRFRQAGAEVIALDHGNAFWQARCILNRMRTTASTICLFGHYFRGAVLGACAGWSGGYPFILPLHEASVSYCFPKLDIYKALIRLATKTVYNSNYTARSFSRLGNYEIIYNGLDCRHIPVKDAFRPAAPVRLVAVGTLTPAKNYPLLIEMMRLLPEPFHLTILGDGQQRAHLEQMSQSLGLSHRVALPGNVKQAAGQLTMWDIFLHPSTKESFGMAVLEALFARLPVVVSDCCATFEIVRGGELGWVADANDAGQWAERVMSLVRNPEKAWRKAVMGRDWAMTHHTDACFVQKMDLLVEALVGDQSA